MKFIARWLLLPVCLVFLFSFPAHAADRCLLDTTNPAITHAVIPIHGGSFQGVSSYAGPSEWVYLSFQTHWATPTTNGMPFDDSQGLLNPATSHIHLEVCMPYLGQITDSIVVPFRLRAFHLKGTFYFNSGPMVQNTVWDESPTYEPWHEFQGDPMGVVVETGHFTFNIHAGDGGPNIHGAMPNGWTIWMAAAIARFANGDNAGIQGELPIWTVTDPSQPENPGFEPNTMAGAGISSVRDGGSAVWGSQIAEVRQDTLPLLAPFNTTWVMPHMFGYMYGGSIGFDGILSMRKDLDLHNGIIGTILPGVPPSGSGEGFLDPALIGTGKHTIAEIWQAKTGPNGIPNVAAPNETATALLVFNVEVGEGSVPTTCTDPTATNFGQPLPCTYLTTQPVDCKVGPWTVLSSTTTSTQAVTSGNSQFATDTTVTQKQRPILTMPANGGAACPLQ